MTRSVNIIPIRATSAQHYAAADQLRRMATTALLGGQYRKAARLTVEAKALRDSGDVELGVELERSTSRTPKTTGPRTRRKKHGRLQNDV